MQTPINRDFTRRINTSMTTDRTAAPNLKATILDVCPSLLDASRHRGQLFALFVRRRAGSPSRCTYPIEAGHIRRFAEAIGDPNPIYVDEAAARAAGHPRIPAPPTFATALRPNDPREGLDIDWKKLLHGEQELTYHRPLYAGDRVTRGSAHRRRVRQERQGRRPGHDGARDRRHRRARRAALHRALADRDPPMKPVQVGDAASAAGQRRRSPRGSSSCTRAPRATSTPSTTTTRSRAAAVSRR